MRNTAAQQKQIMRFVPVAFGFFLAKFPAALFVYWVTSNLITICQNLVVYRDAASPSPPADGSTRDEQARAPEDRDAPSEHPRVVPEKSGRARSRKKGRASKKKG